MSQFKIENYPDACFNKEKEYGFLCLHWNNRGSILDYKAGSDEVIDRFVTPFLKLIDYTMKYTLKEKCFENAYLIPVPSSKRFDDSSFNTEPSTNPYKSAKNRDNRNTIFCQKLSEQNSNLSCMDILKRIKGKEARKSKDAEWHKKSFEQLNSNIGLEKEFLFIVVDDVRTKGNTTEGVRQFLKQHFKEATIVVLCIAQAQLET